MFGDYNNKNNHYVWNLKMFSAKYVWNLKMFSAKYVWNLKMLVNY